MYDMHTNRDFYLAIIALIQEHEASSRSLEEYLRALLGLAQKYQTRASLSVKEFFQLLADAFTDEAVDFDPKWQEQYQLPEWEGNDFPLWRTALITQIVDLREMAEAGTLANEYRYYGVDAPRGTRWYNFDPHTYLECAAVGTFGGWQEHDETGRAYVPGEVLVMENGRLQNKDPREVANPTFVIETVDWDTFQWFLRAGQAYE